MICLLKLLPEEVRKTRVLILLIGLLDPSEGLSQIQCNLQSVQNQPFKIEALRNLQFQYNGPAQTAYIQVQLFNKNQQLLGEFRSRPLEINKRFTHFPDHALSNLMFDYLKDDYERYFRQKHRIFPSGEYTLAVHIVSTESLETIGGSRLTFFNASGKKQIKLLKPQNNGNINGMPLSLKWQPKSTLKKLKNTTYSVKITPVFPWQTPQKAIQNNPAWFQKNKLGTPQYYFNNKQRPLKSGGTYAWQVTAWNKQVKQGKSGVFLFHVKKDQKSRKPQANTLNSQLQTPASIDSLTSSGKQKIVLDSLDGTLSPKDSQNFLKSLLPLNKIPDPDIDFSGRITTEGFYSTRPKKGGFHQRNYLQTRIHSKFKAFGIPLKGDAFLTSQNASFQGTSSGDYFSNNLNRFNLGFDAGAIKQKAKNQLKEEVERYKNLKENQKDLPLSDSNALENLDKLKSEKEAIQSKYGKDYYDKLVKSQELQILEQIQSQDKKKQFKRQLRKHNDTGTIDSFTSGVKDSASKLQDKKANLQNKKQDEMNLLNQYLSTDKQQAKKKLRDSLQKSNPQMLKKFESLERAQQINDLLAKAEEITDKDLKAIGGENLSESLLLNLEQLDIGNFYAHHSPLTLSGMNMQGLNLSYETSRYHLSLAMGRQQNTRFTGLQNTNAGGVPRSQNKTIISGKAGIGSENHSHLYVTFLKGTEQTENQPNKPIQNHVIGTEGQLTFGNRLNIRGEIASSNTNSNSQQLIPGSKEGASTQPAVQNTQKAIAYSLEADFNNPMTNTTVKAKMNKTGPGYYSTGVPFLRKDQLKYQGRLNQAFLRQQIMISPYIQKEQDNMIQWKKATSMVTSYGGMLNITFRNYPQISINYAPYEQRVIHEKHKERNYTSGGQNLQVNGSYQFNISKMQTNSNIGYTYQEISNTRKNTNRFFNTYSYSQTYHFQIPFMLTHKIQYYDQHKNPAITNFELSGRHQISSNFQITLGGNYWKEAQKNEGIGGYTAISFQILDEVSGNIRVEKQCLPGDYFSIYNKQINPLNIRGSVIFNW